ncbi:MAG: sigma-70 family RNA polymerase sigma factor [Planctomycetes bacterium]|nr:sigma-70 family RNA polymerase sigma factor [Planctomycetota bacterium]
MSSPGPSSESGPGGARSFATTRWSLVLAAAHDSRPDAQAALATLCETYWYPLYAYVRRCGYESHDAEDLTQEFFARLLDKDGLASVDRGKGKFRSFLLASLRHFLANERDWARARKRGGGRTVLSFDRGEAETRYRLEPSHELTPEKDFDRQWALTLLGQVLDSLEAEHAASGTERLFEGLKGFLTQAEGLHPYAEVACRLGMTEGAVKVAVHRLRRRYRRLLREQIAQTVAGPKEVDEEIRHLFGAFRS